MVGVGKGREEGVELGAAAVAECPVVRQRPPSPQPCAALLWRMVARLGGRAYDCLRGAWDGPLRMQRG